MARVITPAPDVIDTARLTHDCGAVVEFVRADVKSDQRNEVYVVCPSCGKWIAESVLAWAKTARVVSSR